MSNETPQKKFVTKKYYSERNKSFSVFYKIRKENNYQKLNLNVPYKIKESQNEERNKKNEEEKYIFRICPLLNISKIKNKKCDENNIKSKKDQNCNSISYNINQYNNFYNTFFNNKINQFKNKLNDYSELKKNLDENENIKVNPNININMNVNDKLEKENLNEESQKNEKEKNRPEDTKDVAQPKKVNKLKLLLDQIEANKKKVKKTKNKKKTKLKQKEEEKKTDEKLENKIIKNKYFFSFKNKNTEKKEYKYTFEYIMQFQNWKISKESELIPEITLTHIENLGKIEEEVKNISNVSNANTTNKKSKSSKYIQNKNLMEQWSRKDMTKEIMAATEFKKKLEEKIQEDPIQRNLREYLNMLTKDNYQNIKNNILEIIKDNIEYQEKFLDILFQKAVLEKFYVKLYSQLCKEMDSELPQKMKSEKKNGKQKTVSCFRIKLVNKCKEIFKSNEKIYEYINEKEEDERENKFKKFILGNVNFITELISIKILSKKVAPDCINYLFEKYEDETNDQKLRLINIEAIVIFTDKFGTLINSEKDKLTTKESKIFNEKIEKIFVKLEKIKNSPEIPGYVKFKIINLIEKKKNNYQKTKYEKYIIAKSKKELEEERGNNINLEDAKKEEKEEKEEIITQEEINEKIKEGLYKYKDFCDEELDTKKYPWIEITYLYDIKLKNFDEILEGYIIGCADFIEKESNIKYSKNYIRELIEYYNDKFNENEKNNLSKKILSLFEIVKDFAFETPKIYEIYSYIIYLFIKYKIMEIKNLENIFLDEKDTEEDLYIINNIFINIYKDIKNDSFKNKLKNFFYVVKNKKIFEWLFNKEES